MENQKQNMLTLDEVNEMLYELKKDADKVIKQHNLLLKVKQMMEQILAERNASLKPGFANNSSRVIEMPAMEED